MKKWQFSKSPFKFWRFAETMCFGIFFLCMAADVAAQAQDAKADVLRNKYNALQQQLNQNVFQKPLYLESSETSSNVKGGVYARISHPFSTVGSALGNIDHWCNILMLHLNTKYCSTTLADPAQGTNPVLTLRVGKKHDQPVDQAYRLDFGYRVAIQTRNYLQVRLNADTGPMGTRDYEIVLEAIPISDGQTFLHISYSYGYGVLSRTMMQTYLGTIARNKVGFTKVGTDYVGGMRGVVERNTMRYYLAIEVFLNEFSTERALPIEKLIANWYLATERYPRQLHEMDQSAYVEMKRKEYARTGK